MACFSAAYALSRPSITHALLGSSTALTLPRGAAAGPAPARALLLRRALGSGEARASLDMAQAPPSRSPAPPRPLPSASSASVRLLPSPPRGTGHWHPARDSSLLLALSDQRGGLSPPSGRARAATQRHGLCHASVVPPPPLPGCVEERREKIRKVCP